MKCFICKSEKLISFLSLGHQPPSDAFLTSEDLNREEATYPLDLFFCESCFLVQLGFAVDPEILFRDYVYTTGTNNSLRKNFAELVSIIIEKYKIEEGELAVDIGSNDGTLLLNYLPHKIKVLGIDPSSTASIAIENGIHTVVDFFNKKTALDSLAKYGKARVITATNVFAHVADLDSFMGGIGALLDDAGVFISESGYVADMIEQMQYDSIYHEHLRYYAVKPLVTLFARYGMEIIDIERIPSHGGSIRVHAAKKGAYAIENSVKALLKDEEEKGYSHIDVYHAFAKKVVETKFALLEIILDLKKQNKRIAGIGAPAKGNTLLNYCKLDRDVIDYLTEKSPLKIGRSTPGTHIPVVDESRLFDEQPEAAILLSWNLADELIAKLRKGGYRGKLIIPNPIPKILEQ